VAGFWKAPRVLGPLLTTRVLSPTEFTLLVFVAVSGADRVEGCATTNEYLASSLGVSDKTLRRALRRLRALGLIDYTDHERVAGFTVRTAVTLEEVLGSFETPSVTADASVTAAPATECNPAPHVGKPAVTAAVPRARAQQTETETENVHMHRASSTKSGAPGDAAAGGAVAELEDALAQLELAAGVPVDHPGRALIEAAFVEHAEGTLAEIYSAIADGANGKVSRPAAAAIGALKKGRRLPRGRRRRGRSAAGYCPHCETGAGLHRDDCPTLGGAT
jgi:Helix-turn-helix domain